MTQVSSPPSATPEAPAPPPFAPDPELVGNLEGNERIRRADQQAMREYLRDHEQSSDE